MTNNDYGSVRRDGGVARKPRLLSRLLKAKAVFFAAAFLFTTFAGTATAAHDLGPPWEFTFTGILFDRCGVRSAMAVGVTDAGGSPIHIQVEDVVGNSLAVDPPRAAYASPGDLNPNLPPGCPFDQSGLYTVTTLKLDCTSRFPSLDVVVKQGLFLSVEFHSQSGACNWIPPLDLSGIIEPVHLTAIHPEFVYVTKEFQLGLEVLNNLPIPLLVSVEVVPENDDVCSLASYATASPGMSLREHEYLLERNGSVGIDPLNSGNELALGDMITVSATFKTNAPGDCRLVVLVSIKTATGLEPITFQRRDVHVEVRSPPPLAMLGSMTAQVTGFCRDPMIIKQPPPESQPPLNRPVQVGAGSVDVTATLNFVSACPDDNDNAVLLIEKKDPGTGEWIPVPNGAARLDSPGSQDAVTKVDLPKGFHEFRVRAMYWDDHWDWDCFFAVLGVIPLLIAALLGGAVPLVGWVIAILSFLAAAHELNDCDSIDSISEEYTVLVEAIDPSAVDDAQREVADLVDALGDRIDNLDHDAP